MTQPFGFVPPVAIPAVGGAANAIIPTAGILGGAATGAKAGAVLGPKGALIGGLLGGVLGGLLLPLPTNPGTLPGLDPGLNDPEPTPEPQPEPIPDTPPTPIPVPPGKEGQVLTWTIFYTVNQTRPEKRWCPPTGGGGQVSPEEPLYTSEVKSQSWQAESIKIELLQGYIWSSCGPPYELQENTIIYALWVHLTGGPSDGAIGRRERVNRIRNFEYAQNEPGSKIWLQIEGIEADGEPVPNPMPGPETPTKPRPTPLPIPPLPAPEPEPAPIPIPEPEPQPQPLEVPSPNTPNAPPITIPKAPPAVPQAPPKPSPFPFPQPQPGTVPAPLPVPGVPTIPEPSPDPNVVPAPGPTPLPSPGPAPVPGTDPEPGEAPIPVPPQTPIPTIPATPTTPDTSQGTTPDGSVAPQPTPLPLPTPTDQHFPVPGGPPVTTGGVRPQVEAIAAEVGRIEQKVASLQSNQKDIPWWLIGPILEALGALLENDIPGTTYQLQGICEDVADGQDQPIAEFEVEPAKNLGAIINRLDTIDQMLQQHLAWKTPICKPTITPVGDWRTISFISDEVSPYGKSRLRKRFRYRSLSGVGLSGVIDHWKDFVWSAGPVCVQHAGSPWGTPQCWASSVDEGKRVIRHAAGEAGIDPDQDGRWVISGSDSARVGVPGTMRVNRKGGYYWITARDGSEGRPLVGTVDSPP